MEINRICGMCQGGCQVNVTLEDGKITHVEPDKTSPKGRLCVRGALTPDILYEEKRLTYPMIRDGERGEGQNSSLKANAMTKNSQKNIHMDLKNSRHIQILLPQNSYLATVVSLWNS